jgi:hypothetical protein
VTEKPHSMSYEQALAGIRAGAEKMAEEFPKSSELFLLCCDAIEEQLETTQRTAFELREALAVERNHGDMRHAELEQVIRSVREILELRATELEGVIPLAERVRLANLLWPEESGSDGTVAGAAESDQPHGTSDEVTSGPVAHSAVTQDRDAFWRSVGAGEV